MLNQAQLAASAATGAPDCSVGDTACPVRNFPELGEFVSTLQSDSSPNPLSPVVAARNLVQYTEPLRELLVAQGVGLRIALAPRVIRYSQVTNRRYWFWGRRRLGRSLFSRRSENQSRSRDLVPWVVGRASHDVHQGHLR